MKRLLMIAGVVAALSVGGLLVGGAVSSAQEGEGDGPLGEVGSFIGKVADKLGVTEEELQTAIDEARLETIDEALADGRITEEQADRLRERVEEGLPVFPRGPHGWDRFRMGVCHRTAGLVVESAAEALDVEKEDLVEQLKDGSTLAEVAEEMGLDAEEFKAELLEQVGENLDAMVDAGKLTEEQAERVFSKIEENIDRIVNGSIGDHRPYHHRHGRLGGPLDEAGADGAFEQMEASEVTA